MKKNINSKLVILNSNIENAANQMNNTMRMLFDMKLIYFYNPVSPYINNDEQIISWNNHVSSRLNCGSSFTTIQQYEHILNTNSYHCILFDGSILRSAVTYRNNKLINHSHLWWPSPYDYNITLGEDFTPHILYEEFISDKKWMNAIRMRSPVRIDFDPSADSEMHPATHMHTQNHNCRMKLNKPICFNMFVKFVFQNFYPEISIDFKDWNMLNCSYEKTKDYDYKGTSVIL